MINLPNRQENCLFSLLTPTRRKKKKQDFFCNKSVLQKLLDMLIEVMTMFNVKIFFRKSRHYNAAVQEHSEYLKNTMKTGCAYMLK